MTPNLLSTILNRKVYWSETVVPGYLRVHYDQERYLSNCEDIPLTTIGTLMTPEQLQQEWLKSNNPTQCPTISDEHTFEPYSGRLIPTAHIEYRDDWGTPKRIYNNLDKPVLSQFRGATIEVLT